MKKYNFEEIHHLLDEMEACVNKVRVLCANFNSGSFDSGAYDNVYLD